MDPKLFAKDISIKSKLVKILGCSDTWPARHWTFESLLSRAGADWNWKANFVDDSGHVNNVTEQVPKNFILGKLRVKQAR